MSPKAKRQRVASTDGGGSDWNQAYSVALGNAVSAVLEHPAFKSIRAAPPLALGKGGTQASFDLPTCQKNLRSDPGMYSCAGNLAWINEQFNCMPGVPMNLELVKGMADHNYASPEAAGEATNFVIALDSANVDPREQKGGLKCAKMCEQIHAIWFAVHRDVLEGKVEAIIKAWANWFRRVTFTFRVFASDLEIHYFVENEREKTITEGVVSTPTGLQKVMKLIRFREAVDGAQAGSNRGREATTPAQLFKLYDQRVKFSPHSEELSKEYIEEAILVYDKALIHKPILDIVMSCEGHGFRSESWTTMII